MNYDLKSEEILHLLISAKTGADTVHGLYTQASAKQLVAALRNCKNDFVCAILCTLVGKRQLKTAVPILIQLLGDLSPKVRAEAADALFKIGLSKLRPEVITETGEHLLCCLQREDSVSVRCNIIEAFGGIGYSIAIPTIITALNDPDWKIRGSAAISLGRLEVKYTVPLLLEALADNDSFVRSSAARALGMIGDRQAVKVLEEALSRESDGWTEKCIVNALEHLKP